MFGRVTAVWEANAINLSLFDGFRTHIYAACAVSVLYFVSFYLPFFPDARILKFVLWFYEIVDYGGLKVCRSYAEGRVD